MSDLHEVFYTSMLAPGESPAVLARILARARLMNAQRGITGLLVFDGQHFCQHLEGPEADVRPLMARIAQDPRHVGVRVLHEGPPAARRNSRFDMGFAEPDEADSIALLYQHAGQEALERFLAMRPRFDISG